MGTSQRRRAAGERCGERRVLGCAENMPLAIPTVPESFIVVVSSVAVA